MILTGSTAQKMKFPIKDFSSTCDQIRSFRRYLIHYPEDVFTLVSS